MKLFMKPKNIRLNLPAARLFLELQVDLDVPQMPFQEFLAGQGGPAHPAPLSVLETSAGAEY